MYGRVKRVVKRGWEGDFNIFLREWSPLDNLNFSIR